jgi:hypothetical protein
MLASSRAHKGARLIAQLLAPTTIADLPMSKPRIFPKLISDFPEIVPVLALRL